MCNIQNLIDKIGDRFISLERRLETDCEGDIGSACWRVSFIAIKDLPCCTTENCGNPISALEEALECIEKHTF